MNNGYDQAPTNHTGTVGFALSILSYFTCGILAIPAALISFIGLMGEPEQPKTLAIIGLILCLPSLVLGLFVMFFVVGTAGIAGNAVNRSERIRQQDERDFIAVQKPPNEIRIQAGEGEVIYTEPLEPLKPKYGSRPGSRFTVGPE